MTDLENEVFRRLVDMTLHISEMKREIQGGKANKVKMMLIEHDKEVWTACELLEGG